MTVRHADRLWALGGATIVIALALMSWFFIIGPKYDDAEGIRAEAETTEIQIATLRRRIADLEKENTKLPEYRAALAASQKALPSDPSLEDFLRQLESSGDTVGVSVDGVTVSTATQVSGQTSAFALPIALNVVGSANNLNRFLTNIQQVQPRAVLIKTVGLTAQDQSGGTDDNGMTMSLDLEAFVSVQAGQAAPKITTD